MDCRREGDGRGEDARLAVDRLPRREPAELRAVKRVHDALRRVERGYDARLNSRDGGLLAALDEQLRLRRKGSRRVAVALEVGRHHDDGDLSLLDVLVGLLVDFPGVLCKGLAAALHKLVKGVQFLRYRFLKFLDLHFAVASLGVDVL